MSLAKLTSLSTQTLSLLLERQRLQSLPSFSDDPYPAKPSAMHLSQITRNITRLRSGILELEEKESQPEAVVLLRNQFERMRVMLGEDGKGIESLEKDDRRSTLSEPVTHVPTSAPILPSKYDPEPPYTPYTDDPGAGLDDAGIMLQTQRRMMEDQDQQLDRLAQSISRQHHISLQINDELDTSAGLLEELDTDLDRTESRLSTARRGLDVVARGAIANGSTVTIGLLIFVLLILIVIFKT